MNPQILSESNLIQSAFTLLDQCFPVEEGAHFVTDFPIWKSLPRRNLALFGAVEDSPSPKVVSTTGARICSVKSLEPGVTWKLGMIGAVATDSEFRAQGHATQTVRAALEWCESHGVDATLLWGSEHEFYSRLGFSLQGEQILLPLQEFDFQVDPSHLHQFKFQRGFQSRIFESAAQRSQGAVLQPEDHIWWNDHQSVDWFTVTGVVPTDFAYLGIGRGMDLKNVIHEWGGSRKVLSLMLSSLAKTHPGLLLLLHPLHLEEWNWTTRVPAKPQKLALVKQNHPFAPIAMDRLWVWGLDAV